MMDGLVQFLAWLGLAPQQNIFYIGGSDVLPPPLKGAEEQSALEALEQGDEGAKQLLIEHNLRLVVFIARRFENTGINLEDLISIGTIGLIKAIGTYRCAYGGRTVKCPSSLCEILVTPCMIL